MARQKKLDTNKIDEVLNSPINALGIGEAKAVQALLDPAFATIKDSEAGEIALALQQLIRGQNSLLDNQKSMGDELGKFRARMDKFEKASQKYEANHQKFVEDLYNEADRKQLPAEKRSRVIAKETARYQTLVQEAKAKQTVEHLQFKDQLNKMPKVTVTSMGVTIRTTENDEPTLKLIPEVVRIKNFQWVFQPGVPTEVPVIVADRMQHIRRIKEENAARDKVLRLPNGQMGKQHENTNVIAEWNKINKTYNSPSQDELQPVV